MESREEIFSPQEKIDAFDRIAKHFYDMNFGSASKADIELLMFDIYMQKLIGGNTDADGVMDYVACSDYKISKKLGITQQRVRNLKIKKQLVYPNEFEWKKSLASLTNNARMENSMIVINIPDPNLYYEIQNFIEEKGGYIDVQLNSKLLKIRPEYFLMLCLECEEKENQNKIIKSINNRLMAGEKTNKEITADKWETVKKVGTTGMDIVSLICDVKSAFSPTNHLFTALFEFLSRA